MAHSTGVTWACDRCRRSVTLEAGETPDGWRLHTSRSLDDHDEHDRSWEVCGGCDSQVERLLMDGRDVDAAAAAGPDTGL